MDEPQNASAAAAATTPEPAGCGAFSIRLDVDLLGGDAMGTGGKTASVEECCDACRKHAGCVGFTRVEASQVAPSLCLDALHPLPLTPKPQTLNPKP